jgi:twitching motility protein PilT
MSFTPKHLKSLVEVAMQNNASDIHIREGEPPCLRIRGDLIQVKSNKNIEAQDVRDFCQIIFNDEKTYSQYDKLRELDGVYEIPGSCRMRYNFFKFNGSHGLVLRLVNMKVPTIDELNLSESLKQIIRKRRGLILVTGATGSGKSTTLAAMIDYLNEKETKHILTIEDPIEYLHSQKKSRITQREVGRDTEDYLTGLRSALRQDPDVILLGELRDSESVAVALKAAETGHLVLATVHTTDAVATISRILSMFPPEEVNEVKKRLAESLYSTISQRMLKAKDKGKIAIAQEIMVSNPGVKECIRGDEPLERILTIIEKGGTNELDITCQSFDQHILQLYEKGLITQKEAEKSVKSKSNFLQKLLIEE